MKKASEYRQHAEECRDLARRAKEAEHRDMLLNMAATWDSLAAERLLASARRQHMETFEIDESRAGDEAPE